MSNNVNRSSLMKYLINCLYTSAEGEGVHIGHPQIFVRFQGCLIGCVNCDSKETWDFKQATERTLEDVLAEIESLSHKSRFPIKRVSITGGDPLHPRHEQAVYQLAQVLKERNFFINIEASGTRVVEKIFDLVDFISFDYKTPSTKVKTSFAHLKTMQEKYPHKTQFKSVIASMEDFWFVAETFEELRILFPHFSIPWCLTPSWEPGHNFTPENILLCLQYTQENGYPFRVIGQQHKWIYGPDSKQV